VLDVFLQQNAVVQFQHLQVNAADGGMVTVSSAYLHSEQRTQPEMFKVKYPSIGMGSVAASTAS
jgi:hypothetical protein